MMALSSTLVDTFAKVISILKMNVNLKDDTYMAHLIDSTCHVIGDIADLKQLGLLSLLQECLQEHSYIHLRPFLLRLSGQLICKLPDIRSLLLSFVQLPNLKEWDWGDTDKQEELHCLVEFYVSVLKTEKESAKELTLSHQTELWENLMLPLVKNYHINDLYIQRSVINILAAYFRLYIAAFRQTSNNEIRHCLEAQLKSIISCESSEKLNAEMLVAITALLDQKELYAFYYHTMKKNIDFSSLLLQCKNGHSPKIIKLYILIYEHEDAVKVKTTLFSLLKCQSCSLNNIKQVIRQAAEHPHLQLFETVVPHLLLEDVDRSSVLLSYLLSLHFIPGLLESCASLPTLIDHLFMSIMTYTEDISDDEKYIKNVSNFLSKLVKARLLENTRFATLMPSLLNISSLHLTVSENIRRAMLDLFAVILNVVQSLKPLESSTIINTSCSLSLDSTHWTIQDSALNCISSLLANSSLDQLSQDSLSMIFSTLQLCLERNSDMTSYVKASAIRAQTSLINSSSCVHFSSRQLLSLLPFSCSSNKSVKFDAETFFENYSELERRELVRLSTQLYGKLLSEDIKDGNFIVDTLEKFIIVILIKDQDWETKRLTIDFWRLSMFHESKRAAWMTGLLLGCQDYEASVSSDFRTLAVEFERTTKQTGQKRKDIMPDMLHNKVQKMDGDVNLTSMNKNNGVSDFNEHFGEKVQNLHEKVIPLKDHGSNILDNVHFITKAEFEWLFHQLEDEPIEPSNHENLQAIMEDIINSVTTANLIDLVDCY